MADSQPLHKQLNFIRSMLSGMFRTMFEDKMSDEDKKLIILKTFEHVANLSLNEFSDEKDKEKIMSGLFVSISKWFLSNGKIVVANIQTDSAPISSTSSSSADSSTSSSGEYRNMVNLRLLQKSIDENTTEGKYLLDQIESIMKTQQDYYEDIMNDKHLVQVRKETRYLIRYALNSIIGYNNVPQIFLEYMISKDNRIKTSTPFDPNMKKYIQNIMDADYNMSNTLTALYNILESVLYIRNHIQESENPIQATSQFITAMMVHNTRRIEANAEKKILQASVDKRAREESSNESSISSRKRQK